MSKELLLVVETVSHEKGVSKEVIFDALELALAVTQEYAVQLRAEDANVKEVFSSLRSLSAYIAENTS